MHARNRTWPLGSDPAERCRQRTMPVEGGDGSTLSLDFTTGVLDPRLTFTRTTNATFINSSGLVEWAGANAMTQSNDFSVSPWAVSNVSVSIDGTSPVGNAWKILENSANDVHRLNPGGISSGIPGTGVPVSISIHVKQGSGSRQAYMLISDNGTGDVRSKRLDPVTGTLVGTESSGGSWSNASTSVQNLGNGWYRLTLTATRGGGSALICRTGLSDSSGNLTYQGDGTSFLYFSGHQINPGSTAQQYYATTGSAYHAPRFDYDPTSIGSPRGLLIEGQVENRVTQSESFSGWTLASAVLGATALGPDGNTSSALTLREDNTTNPHACVLTGRTVTSGSSATFSVFVKAGASPRRYILIRVNDNASNANAASVMWDTQTRTISGAATAYGTFTNVSATRTEYAATSWDRIALTFTPSTATIACKLELSNNGSRSADGQSVAYLGDNSSGVLIWGAQLETGSGASSYIPTGASQGSRSEDNCSIVSPNFAPWYNQGEGTFLLHCRLNRLGAQHLLNVNVNNAAPRLMITDLSNNFNAAGENPSGTNFSFSLGSSSTNSTKVIAAFKSLDNAGTRNGGTVQTNATLTVPTTVNLMRIGSAEGGYQYMTGTISLLKYWPTRLPNAQLQSLTT
jgi:hypothetical protein